MGPASLSLRLTAGQVAPYGWSVGAAFKPLLKVDMPGGHKAPCCAASTSIFHLHYPDLVRERKEKEEI